MYNAKLRKYRGIFKVKHREKTRQVRENWSQQLEHKQVVNWNPLVCRKSKCDNIPPKQQNLRSSNKQKRFFLWCPWSQVQQDTSGPCYFWIMLFFGHHRCTYKWDWTEMLFSFPLIAKTVWIPRVVWIQKDVGENRGTICTHWNANCPLEDFSDKSHENIVD